MATAPALPDFAPDTEDFYLADPDAAFARLRREDPVHWYEGGGFWCVTRHADVQEVSRSPRRFTSTRGTQIFQIAHANAGRALVDGPDLDASAMAPTILQMDPPAHNRYRKLVIGAFTPRAVAALAPRVRELARESLAAVPRGETVNLVDALAVPLPMYVIADMLGVPHADRDHFRRWSDAMVSAGAGGFDEQTVRTVTELMAYFADRVAERRRAPKDDLVTTLVQAEIDGERLTEPEIHMFLLTMLVAGNETTRNLISGGTQLLLDHPGELERLREDPALLPNAVEEMLRLVSPVRNFVRCATQDTELGGTSIGAGEYVAMFYGSANRDEAVFGPDADRFDVARRTARQHVAFGFGEHLCLGAALARLEARVLFEELLPHLPALRPAGAPVPLRSNLMNGFVDMPVVWAA